MKVTARNWQTATSSLLYQSVPQTNDNTDVGTKATEGLSESQETAAADKTAQTVSQTSQKEDRNSNDTKASKEENELAMLNRLAESLSSQNSKKSNKNNYNLSSSKPEDTVGGLAALLARSETRFDVLQVSGKAMRALANLKMSYMASDGDQAKKIARTIKRMEKLIKRIQKKLQHLKIGRASCRERV